MGDPRKPRKKYATPRNPWRSDELANSLYLVGTYGLRNRRELWKASAELSRIRKQARQLLAAPPEVRVREETKLLSYLNSFGLTAEGAGVDDVLTLSVEDLLGRRLQTLVWKKGLAMSPHQARQIVVHGHVKVNGRTVNIPGYMVKRDEEPCIAIRDGSPMAKQVLQSAAQ